MVVQVRVPSVLRGLCGGQAALRVDLAEGATAADLLDAIGADYPALERRVRDERGALRTHVNVFVGDEEVRVLGGLGTALDGGAEVSIIAAISGG